MGPVIAMLCALVTSIMSSILFEYLKEYKANHQLPWGSIINWLIKAIIVAAFIYADNVGCSKNMRLLLALLFAITCWIPFALSKKPVARFEIITEVVCPIVTIILADIDIIFKLTLR